MKPRSASRARLARIGVAEAKECAIDRELVRALQSCEPVRGGDEGKISLVAVAEAADAADDELLIPLFAGVDRDHIADIGTD